MINKVSFVAKQKKHGNFEMFTGVKWHQLRLPMCVTHLGNTSIAVCYLRHVSLESKY